MVYEDSVQRDQRLLEDWTRDSNILHAAAENGKGAFIAACIMATIFGCVVVGACIWFGVNGWKTFGAVLCLSPIFWFIWFAYSADLELQEQRREIEKKRREPVPPGRVLEDRDEQSHSRFGDN